MAISELSGNSFVIFVAFKIEKGRRFRPKGGILLHCARPATWGLRNLKIDLSLGSRKLRISLIRRRAPLSPQNGVLRRGACPSTSRHTIRDGYLSAQIFPSVYEILGKRRRSRPQGDVFFHTHALASLEAARDLQKRFSAMTEFSVLNGGSSVSTAIANFYQVQNILGQKGLVQNREVSLYTDELLFV
ncbi:MAG: hypothetical protein QOF62_129 [Pyrinomonadaceae bacterium]|nr:hypothetical protein [Pyrinomonadaceae bacterium]